MSKVRHRIYSQYVESWTDDLATREFKDLKKRAPTMNFLINKFFPQDKSAKILDLGCGHGTLIYFSHQAGYTQTGGIDTSVQQVNLAKKFGIKNVECGDIQEKLKTIEPNSLDVIVTFDVIEHLTKDELVELIDAVHRVLKKGGRWVIHAPNGAGPFVGTILYGDITHEQAYTQQSLFQVLHASGFTQFQFSECYPLPSSIKGLVRYLLWKVYRIHYLIGLFIETGSMSSKVLLTRNLYCMAMK